MECLTHVRGVSEYGMIWTPIRRPPGSVRASYVLYIFLPLPKGNLGICWLWYHWTIGPITASIIYSACYISNLVLNNE